jgi:hypothetical protein
VHPSNDGMLPKNSVYGYLVRWLAIVPKLPVSLLLFSQRVVSAVHPSNDGILPKNSVCGYQVRWLEVRVSLPVSWFEFKPSLWRAVHILKSGMDPKNNVSRLAGTTTGIAFLPTSHSQISHNPLSSPDKPLDCKAISITRNALSNVTPSGLHAAASSRVIVAVRRSQPPLFLVHLA